MNHRIIVFETELGSAGLQHRDGTLTRTTFGHPASKQVLRELSARRSDQPDALESRWVELFQAYAQGQKVSFDSLRIDQSWMTPFQKAVVDACRQIPRGETLTYGQLAQIAGSPSASRAVGTVMAKNRFPLVVPCHRVVSSNGLGGFSAPDGLRQKTRLLELEGAIEFC